MNAGNQPHSANGQAPASGLDLDAIYFTLFRHKWLILAFFCLGIVGVIGIRMLRPPPFVSKAKLMVLYVNDLKVTSSTNQDESFLPTDPGGEAVLNSEIEILKSRDVALQVADLVGPQRILAKLGGGTNRNAAAGVVASGVEVEIPARTSILTVSFKNPDPDLVQPVLDALIKVYQRKHIDVRENPEVRDEFYARQRDELSAKIIKADQDLRELKDRAKVIIPDDAKRYYQARILKAQDELFDAERELAERKAISGNTTPGSSPQAAGNAVEAVVPPATISDYSEITRRLEALRASERAYLLDGYKDMHPLLERVREQIGQLNKQKAGLEAQFPTLPHMALAPARDGTNSLGTGVFTEQDEITRLTVRVRYLGSTLSNLQSEAARVTVLEPEINTLQRQRDDNQRTYDSIVSRLNLGHGGNSAAGQLINMSVVQSSTPPIIDQKKLYKMMGAVFAGCVGMGFALAFLIDLVLDRTIKRGADIERLLRLPVFLAIPDTSWKGGIQLPGLGRRKRSTFSPAPKVASNGCGSGTMALALPSERHHLQTYTEGLRERLITYFEVHNLNLKKPKLVAVTGCGEGAGVTTLASGLAAELSKTGQGNVLLVDMNGGQGMAHPFYNGKPGCGLAEVLEPNGRAGALVEDNLYVASIDSKNGDNAAKVLPTPFNHLVPKLKASDYDYIIFDMPPVSPTSATPRLASHMDIVLLVLESEKTGQHAAARAASLMREARANVATVLNKCRPHVPAFLAQDT